MITFPVALKPGPSAPGFVDPCHTRAARTQRAATDLKGSGVRCDVKQDSVVPGAVIAYRSGKLKFEFTAPPVRLGLAFWVYPFLLAACPGHLCPVFYAASGFSRSHFASGRPLDINGHSLATGQACQGLPSSAKEFDSL